MRRPRSPIAAMARYRDLLVLAILTALTAPAIAAPAQLPLLSRDGWEGKPNLMLTMDDSGSMEFQFMPDALAPEISATGDPRWLMGYDMAESQQQPTSRTIYIPTVDGDLATARLRSNHVNRIYYNPAIRYLPWAYADGTLMPDAPPNAAPINPVNIGLGSANLTNNRSQYAAWCRNSSCFWGTLDYWPATYFDFTGTDANALSSFTRVQIGQAASYARPDTRTDCNVSVTTPGSLVCTAQQELQNFANWFTYYRSRAYLAIASTSLAFAEQGDGLRVGYGRINKGNGGVDGQWTRTVERGVRDFSGADREAFFTWLHGRTGSGGTPLRRAMGDVGEYFRRADNRGPWGERPGSNDNTAHLECRKSYSIMVTDGYWNGAAASQAAAGGNVDNTEGPTTPITGPGGQSYRYVPSAPFRDTASGTLADVAMYYWNRDLRPDLANRVRPDADNPAFWQQLVQFTVGLGVDGTLDPDTDLSGLTAGTTAWPNVVADSPSTIDDLWHAAINSRGRYLSATNPAEFTTAMGAILQRIAERQKAEGGAAVSSVTLETSSRKFIPTYRTGKWSGDIQAKSLDINGVSIGDLWQASDRLPAPAARNILMGTGGTTAPVPFKWDGLNATRRGWLGPEGSADLVAFLRGDRSKEGSPFRVRDPDSVIGDIVNSTPLLVGGLLDEQYNFLPAGTDGADSYRAFVNAKKARNRVLFIGANDGMLHGFREADGVEVFGFIPRAVVGNLAELADTNYGHRYYVDGPIEEADAWFDNKWNNLLIGTLGAGGKSIYALNVTDLDSPGAGNVMWETTNAAGGNPLGIGHVFAPVQVGLLKDGRWAAFVGSGFESTNGRAELLILNVQTGALIKRLSTSGGTDNGLGGVRLIRDRNNVVVGAYAGDLKGNMWRFDLSSTAPTDWAVGFGNKPLYTARDVNNVPQPITAQPEYIDHPAGGQLVLFGTGKLFEEVDLTQQDPQSLYGVWDKTPGNVSSADGEQFQTTDSLVLQAFGTRTTGGETEFIRSSATPVDYATKRGWRLNLTLDAGQRAIYAPQLIRGFALFSTVAPMGGTGLPCDDSQSAGYNVLINALNGAAPPNAILDTNADGTIDSSDDNASTYKTVADGKETIQLGKGGLIVIQRAFGQTNASLAGRALERSWRQLLNPPR